TQYTTAIFTLSLHDALPILENATGTTIHYQYRWGDKHEWKKMELRSGAIEKHTYPLGEDRNKKVPTPYVRFDRIGGDNSVTLQRSEEHTSELQSRGHLVCRL